MAVCGALGSLIACAEPPAKHVVVTAPVLNGVLETSIHPWLRWPDLKDVTEDLRRLYAAESDGLVWFDGGKPHPAASDAVAAIAHIADRGLAPTDYDAELLKPTLSDPTLFDLALSVGVLRAMDAVHRGRVDPTTLGWGYDTTRKTLDRAALLREAREGHGVSALLDGLEPAFPHYRRNRETLARYRRLVEAGEPPMVPEPPRAVDVGEPWRGVIPLRQRLTVFGDLDEDTPLVASRDGKLLYDGAVAEGVKRFQKRHILKPDGIVGKKTLAALNVPLAARVRQLELAMERGRWLPSVHERPTIFVNVPLFRLWASDPAEGHEPLRMKVVVGKALRHRTPIFVDHVEYVVFHPYWNPTYRIATREILPKARKDPLYLASERLEIVASGRYDAASWPATSENLDAVARGRLFLRQTPGPDNALGLVKFIFPNDNSVYMHGTPAPHLFQETRRDFSHGCIRVEKPRELAEFVLRNQPEWTPERIDEAMRGPKPEHANLSEPLMVVLFYDTVHVNSEGVVHFAEDIYRHDRALDAALGGGYPYTDAQRGVRTVRRH